MMERTCVRDRGPAEHGPPRYYSENPTYEQSPGPAAPRRIRYGTRMSTRMSTNICTRIFVLVRVPYSRNHGVISVWYALKGNPSTLGSPWCPVCPL